MPLPPRTKVLIVAFKVWSSCVRVLGMAPLFCHGSHPLSLPFPLASYLSFAILCPFQKGFIKRTPLATFKSTSNRGLIIISLGEDDTLRWVKR